jgi:hypothetical protein
MRKQVHSQKRFRYLVAPTFVVVILGLLSVTLLSAKPLDVETGVVEVPVKHGMVDWSNGLIRASGLGVPSAKAKIPSQALEMAKTAARVVAIRNLLEIVEGIQVDSHRVVKNFMVESDIINTKVQGIIRGARVIEEKALTDGAYRVTVEMKLAGYFQNTILPPSETEPEPLTFFHTSPPPDISSPPPDITPDISIPPHDHGHDVVYTGLIVDAQGLDVKEAMSPKLIMEDGRVVYGAEWVDQEVYQQQTIVGYINGIPNAKTHERVISTPFVVKALRVDANNPSDLVISDADAQTLHLIPEHLAFLRKAKVLVVLEP